MLSEHKIETKMVLKHSFLNIPNPNVQNEIQQ